MKDESEHGEGGGFSHVKEEDKREEDRSECQTERWIVPVLRCSRLQEGGRKSFDQTWRPLVSLVFSTQLQTV